MELVLDGGKVIPGVRNSINELNDCLILECAVMIMKCAKSY
jgi:hypothetical protein